MKNKKANYTYREFIKTAGLAAAGFVLGTNKSFAASPACRSNSREFL
jgi:hypothetical protein